jgi:quercetin dioxygenase-like cupin family protein
MCDKEKSTSVIFSQIKEYFSPKIIGEVNDVFIKLAIVKGDDVPWHTHDNEDEMFLIMDGSLVMEIEGEPSFTLSQGDYYIVKKGISHRVYSKEECQIMLVEPKETKHTGEVESNITKDIDKQYLK